MIPIDELRDLLGEDAHLYDDERLKQLSEYLFAVAHFALDEWLKDHDCNT